MQTKEKWINIIILRINGYFNGDCSFDIISNKINHRSYHFHCPDRFRGLDERLLNVSVHNPDNLGVCKLVGLTAAL